MWAIDLDDNNDTLLDAVSNAIGQTQSNYTKKEDPYRCSPIKGKIKYTLKNTTTRIDLYANLYGSI